MRGNVRSCPMLLNAAMGIAEEHRAEPADGKIESLRREAVVLRVGVFDRDVANPFGLGERTGPHVLDGNAHETILLPRHRVR